MADDLERKRKLVLAYERGVARGVALEVVPSPPLSAWEVLIPVFLIFNFARRSQSRDWFEANLLVTKRRALEAAFDLCRGTAVREEVRRRFEEEMREIQEKASTEIYGDAVRAAQLEEMEVLTDHFVRLLGAAGGDAFALLRSAYGTESACAEAMNRICEAEKAVVFTSREFLGERSDPEFVDRMVRATERIRGSAAARAFGTDE